MTDAVTNVTSAVPHRVASLRVLADSDLARARAAAVAWMKELAAGYPTPPVKADIEELFALGEPPRPVGPSRGHVLGWADWRGLDPVGRALFTLVKTQTSLFGTERFWLGKTYDVDGVSSNEWTNLFGQVARFVFPGVLNRKGEIWEGLGMSTYVEDAISCPGTPALVLDFSTVESNPKLGCRIRDEVVQIVPGVHLARKMWNTGAGYVRIADWYETVRIHVGDAS